MAFEFASCCILCKSGQVQDIQSLKYLHDKYKSIETFIKLFKLPKDPYEDLVGKAVICQVCLKKLEEIQDLDKNYEEAKKKLEIKKEDLEKSLFDAQEGQENYIDLHDGELLVSKGDIETRNKICEVILTKPNQLPLPLSLSSSSLTASTCTSQEMQLQIVKVEHLNQIDHNNTYMDHDDQMEWTMNTDQPQPQNNVTRQVIYSYHQQVEVERMYYDGLGNQSSAEVSNPNQFTYMPQILQNSSRTLAENPDENLAGNSTGEPANTLVLEPVITVSSTIGTGTTGPEVIVEKRGRGRPRKDGKPSQAKKPSQKKVPSATSAAKRQSPRFQKKG